MMLALRRLPGVKWEELTAWMGADPRQIYEPEIRELHEQGLIDAGTGHLRLTPRGLMVADSVMERFFKYPVILG